MSAEPRSNSAVRNLRSIFENRASESSPSARGRSPGGLGDLDTSRPRSKVRASFIAVEPTKNKMSSPPDSDLKREESSVGQRRTSFSGGHSGDVFDQIKDTVTSEQERRDEGSTVAETIPENAIESAGPTPALELNKSLNDVAPAAPGAAVEDKPAENPDKPVTGAEEEPAEMKPADPVSESVVSGGAALPPVAEDLRKNKDIKPSSISTKVPKPASVAKSPAAQAKSPLSPSTKAPAQRLPTKKPSRSSLTAPTAASVARAAQGASATSNAPKPKPREATKPADISSRLTAPTAASRARLESNASSTSTAKPTASTATTSRPKPTSSARPTPRSSLAGRPDSRGSQAAVKKPAPVGSDFLERMTRPTAASSNRTHEKPVEVKSPPKKQMPLRPKTNGQPKPKAANEPGEAVDAALEHDSSTLPQSDNNETEAAKETTGQVVPAAPDTAPITGNETPLAHTNGAEDAPALESTPAAIGGEDTIR